MSETSLAMMPWFARDWLAATRHLALAERGAYHDLLCFQWEMGRLPTDHARLAKLLGISLDEFAQLWPAISEKFVATNGWLFNKRLEEHRVKALEQRDKKRKGAEIANAKRPAKRHAERPAERQLQPQPAASAQRAPPSPSPSSEEDIHTHAREGFLKVKAAYPQFAGNQADWMHAEHHCLLRLERDGLTWGDLIGAAERYAAYVNGGGVSSTQYVKLPSKFFSVERGWEQPWTPPVAIPRAKAAQPPFVAPPDEPEKARA